MTVDMLMDWFATLGDFPVLAFILAVVISGIPLFLVMALNAMVAVYVERKVSAFMMDRIEYQNIKIGKYEAKLNNATINFYFTPTLLTTNSLVFNKKQMLEWWKIGYEYAKTKEIDRQEIPDEE